MCYGERSLGLGKKEALSLLSNFEFLSLIFKKHIMDLEAVWLVGTFVELVWVEKNQRKRHVKINHFIGHMKLRYQANQVSKKPLLGFIINIS